MAHPPLHKNTVNAIRALWVKGWPRSDIADSLSVGLRTITKYTRDLPRPGRGGPRKGKKTS